MGTPNSGFRTVRAIVSLVGQLEREVQRKKKIVMHFRELGADRGTTATGLVRGRTTLKILKELRNDIELALVTMQNRNEELIASLGEVLQTKRRRHHS